MATDPKKIVQLLADVMGDVEAVAKSDFNSHFKFRFRGVDAVTNAVAPALRKHGVVFAPLSVDASYRDVQSGGKPARECTVQVLYRFYGPAGDHLDVHVPGEAIDQADKGTSKAMSVAYRTALLQALCLPTGDKDPDHDSPERDEHPAPTLADRLRGEILAEAKQRDLSTRSIAEDFEARTKVNIKDAEPKLLEHYLGYLRTHGMPAAEEVPA